MKKHHKSVLEIWFDPVSNIKIWAHFHKVKYAENQIYQNTSKKLFFHFYIFQQKEVCKGSDDF